MDGMNCTNTFTSKLKKWIKFDSPKGLEDFSSELTEAFNTIKALGEEAGVELAEAERYFEYHKSNGNFSGVDKNIFKKHKPFEDDKLHFIYVICNECGGVLMCSNECEKKITTSVCLYDVFYEN